MSINVASIGSSIHHLAKPPRFVLLNMPPMKRKTEQFPDAIQSSKRRRSSDSGAYLDSIERIQDQLVELDKECASQQLVVQRKFDALKVPLIVARAEAIGDIPGFWKKAIMNHPDVKITTSDIPVLDYLEQLHLMDNEDDYGSHTIVLSFKDGNPFFSEKEVVKKVEFSADESEIVRNSSISWAPNKKPTGESFFGFFEIDVSFCSRRDCDVFLAPF